MSENAKTYRIYSYDAARGNVSADWLKAGDDAEALVLAEARGFGTKGELWDGKRLVAQLEAKRLQA